MHFIDLVSQQARIKPALDERIQNVLAHGKYIMGPEVKELEEKLAAFCGAKHCISCANGTDALSLALMALDVSENDAVFAPSFTFAATVEVVSMVGATPFLVDIDPHTFNMCPASLRRCIEAAQKAGLRPAVVIPVDLFGLPADYREISAISAEYGMRIIDDSAQGFGGTIDGQMTGVMADITTTSFFPAKPLGAYGDGGALFTDNDELAILLDSLRVHGKGTEKYDNVRVGMNSRLDTLQAAILLEKLAIYADEIAARQASAERYTAALSNHFTTPHTPEGYTSIWAQYTLRAQNESERDAIREHLTTAGVPTVIYYPKPLHEQTAYQNCPHDPAGLTVSSEVSKTVFSLPMHGYLTEQDATRVIEAVQSAKDVFTGNATN
ncbi:MAG: DegT/DnrJ/EryC1/StrS family aminotransferase [Pikeienuella sp.]